jgi:6-phosphogluconolactonase
MGAGMNAPETSRGRLRVAADPGELVENAARTFIDRAAQAIAARGVFRVALSGGNTPRPVYVRLADSPYRDEVDWSHVHVFFSDERFVPLDSPESNYHTAYQALLSRVPIPERFVHPFATVDIAPEEAASLYEEGIRRVFEAAATEIPSFDLILLGMGADGHTASLFPDTEALTVTERLVVANFVPKLDTWRITFTYPLINAAHCVLFMVQGADKAERLTQVLSGAADLPAARVRPSQGELLWIVDQAAAEQVQGAQGGSTEPAG